MPKSKTPRNAYAREIAVAYWEAEVAAAQVRFNLFDAQYRNDYARNPHPEGFRAAMEIHGHARTQLIDAQENLADAKRGGFVKGIRGKWTRADDFLERDCWDLPS